MNMSQRQPAVPCALVCLPRNVWTPPGRRSFTLLALRATKRPFSSKPVRHGWPARWGLYLIAPDTSPRGQDVADDDAYDLGQGAGFYLDALQAPWRDNFRMHEYITHELLQLMRREFDLQRFGIFGHSMGGHGALTIGLKHPEVFRSLSAFAPICAPSECPWGHKAFRAYLGEDRAAWREYDAVSLIHDGATWPQDQGPILIDQGDADEFLAEQLHPQHLQGACAEAGITLHLRQHAGFDHGYYFISTFMAEHLTHHARYLCADAPGV